MRNGCRCPRAHDGRVEDLYQLVPLRFHPLTGDRRGQYALRLTGQMRMIVAIEDERSLIVEEVVDYRD